ncbi:hypothetical protein PCL1606_16830 [Pseudomonas chlororaphis]|uniref:Uncharacterized protein n=1 Tax=Pseudomonas chlororaphis TaxID=587753 RepID=A0A0D5XVQ3_9PSED|nr:hypothetical protein PCL1606_16830 [Pseudomonas chlororaphis]
MDHRQLRGLLQVPAFGVEVLISVTSGLKMEDHQHGNGYDVR